MGQIVNAVKMAHALLLPKLKNAYNVIDATAGNGKDTLFLATNTPPDAVIWAFDIQQTALDKTQALLADHGQARKVKFILASHVHIADFVKSPVDAAMFNLGYLPGGDHTVTTMPNTTVAALNQLLALLKPTGIISIVAYPGHDMGRREELAVRSFLAALPQKLYTVACWQMVNQVNNPPVLYIVERTG
ncbi:tRNA (mnm(5)s(2)U34)-methyltransferase [Sporolituus thermophilus]|uniref:rRNA methylase n=1 Tax=Sporolituus thermophilus DSM 23256 TaxID=1123285 RepID=A0A1G7IAK9_9FIRM|nr:class I SAM-dependent methyltransferase [Sporolituus thermophilus]SDF09705.1 Putative rRNA methylase [Sporolituus thermophilus DSM 23256]